VGGVAIVVERKVLRGQRRWQTFAFRTGFVAAVCGVFGFVYPGPLLGVFPDTGVLLLHVGTIIRWTLGLTIFLVSASLWFGVRMATPSRSWMASVGCISLIHVGPVLVTQLSRPSGGTADAMRLLNPLLDTRSWSGLVPLEAFASGLCWRILAAVPFARNASTLGRCAR
jgi:hypothetical protein